MGVIKHPAYDEELPHNSNDFKTSSYRLFFGILFNMEVMSLQLYLGLAFFVILSPPE
jgi:hypothetical protein